MFNIQYAFHYLFNYEYTGLKCSWHGQDAGCCGQFSCWCCANNVNIDFRLFMIRDSDSINTFNDNGMVAQQKVTYIANPKKCDFE